MDFRQRRRQQFLTQEYCEKARIYWHEIRMGQEANLLVPEGSERGWHAGLLHAIAGELQDKLFLNYTAGEPIESLRAELEQVVAAFERYGEYLWKDTGDRNEPVFKFYSLDEYCQLMQIVGLCFLLHRRDLLPRVAALQDGEDRANGGADWLFEEFVAYAPMTRHESDTLSASAPYKSLADAMCTEDNVAAHKELDRYLKRWYKDLDGTGWYNAHAPEGGGEPAGYFGYWCFEAGAAVILLGIEDDSAFHKYLYYPKDLVAWCRANAALSSTDTEPNAATAAILRCEGGQPCPRAGYWFTPARLKSRQQFVAGDIMPKVGGDYGVTIWQWDQQQ